MARPDVRRPARPVRHRPTPVRRLRTRARRRVLSATAEARPRHRNHYRSAPSSAARLTDRSRVAIITTPTLRTPTSGPMPLANEWSHQAGERHAGPPCRSVPPAGTQLQGQWILYNEQRVRLVTRGATMPKRPIQPGSQSDDVAETRPEPFDVGVRLRNLACDSREISRFPRSGARTRPARPWQSDYQNLLRCRRRDLNPHPVNPD